MLSITLIAVVSIACEDLNAEPETEMHNELPEGAVVVDIDGHLVIMLDGMAIGMYESDMQWDLINDSWIPSEMNTADLEKNFIGVTDEEGLILDLGQATIDLFDLYDFKINLPTPQDTLYFIVQNPSEEDKNGMLKLFYNYQEILFKVQGRDEYVSELLFQIPSGYELIIPFQLYNGIIQDDVVNSLIVGLFESPEK